MLHIAPVDKLDADKPGPTFDSLLKQAVKRKSDVDAEFDKLATAAIAARARVDQ